MKLRQEGIEDRLYRLNRMLIEAHEEATRAIRWMRIENEIGRSIAPQDWGKCYHWEASAPKGD